MNDPIDFKSLARTITLVENERPGYEDILIRLKPSSTKIIGITGPPGAGKSSLTDALIEEMIHDGKKVAVLCVDPSSPFNKGALLGDRIRMGEWYNNPHVFIRSLASKGSLGGLHPKIMEIADVVKNFAFDYVIIETVGVGQSEVDIAALADVTVVVLVPEGGDVIQTMKAGLMEIAEIFVVNKSDRPGAQIFTTNLKHMLRAAGKDSSIPVVNTVATAKNGVADLYKKIAVQASASTTVQNTSLLTQRVWNILEKENMKRYDTGHLEKAIQSAAKSPGFNLYLFAKEYMAQMQ